MEAIAIGDQMAPVTVDDLLAIHAMLMAGDERARSAGPAQPPAGPATVFAETS